MGTRPAADLPPPRPLGSYDPVLLGSTSREPLLGLHQAELDEAEELDDGDPVDLGARYRELHRLLPSLRVVGGCCGTDHQYVAEVCRALRN